MKSPPCYSRDRRERPHLEPVLYVLSYLPVIALAASRSKIKKEKEEKTTNRSVDNFAVIPTFVNVGLCVGEARCLTCLPPKQAPQVGSHLVAPFLFHCVTLGTLLDKRLLPFLDVPHNQQLHRRQEKLHSVKHSECTTIHTQIPVGVTVRHNPGRKAACLYFVA